jgi:hypothetical protein
VVLYRHRRDPDRYARDERDRQQVGTRPRAARRCPRGRGDVLAAARQRATQVDEHVLADEHEPDDGSRAVQAPGGGQGLAVKDPHRDAAREQHDSDRDEKRREEPHPEPRRAAHHVRLRTRVVAGEPPTRAGELQQHRRDQHEADEDVQRHEAVHAEENRRDLDEREQEHDDPDARGEALVPHRVEPLAAR